MKKRGGGREGFPWRETLFDALSMGISFGDYWRMSPRAVVLMQQEWIRRHEDQGEKKNGRKKLKRLERIPRP